VLGDERKNAIDLLSTTKQNEQYFDLRTNSISPDSSSQSNSSRPSSSRANEHLNIALDSHSHKSPPSDEYDIFSQYPHAPAPIKRILDKTRTVYVSLSFCINHIAFVELNGRIWLGLLDGPPSKIQI